MSEVHASANSAAAPGDWIDLRERAAHGGSKAGARAKTSGLDTDATIAFALFLTMLFIPQLETAGAALFTLVAVAYAIARVKQLSAVFVPRAFLLAIPAVAIFSALWSDEPLLTLKYSLEFALTVVAGLLLSAAPRPKPVLEGIFIAFAIYLVASLGLGQTVKLGADGDTAFAGLNDSKNLLADTAASGFLISLGVFFIGIEDRKFSRCAAALLAAPIQVYAIMLSRSAGALVGLVLAGAVFPFFLTFRKTSLSVRATALGVLGLCLAFIALAYQTLADIVVEVATRYFDKDTTFTGRTYLWQRAGDLIAEKPFLGRGFHAFWYQGNPDAEGLWRYLGIRTEYGFNFHNSFVELLVHLGWLGVAVFTLCVLGALALVTLRFVRRPNLAICFWLSMLVYQCVRMPIETIGTVEFSYTTVLLFMGLGFAFAPMPEARRRQRSTEAGRTPAR